MLVPTTPVFAAPFGLHPPIDGAQVKKSYPVAVTAAAETSGMFLCVVEPPFRAMLTGALIVRYWRKIENSSRTSTPRDLALVHSACYGQHGTADDCQVLQIDMVLHVAEHGADIA